MLISGAAWACARADEGAFTSLVGMAQAAKTDRGPDAGPAPDRAAAGAKTAKAEVFTAPGAAIDDGAPLKDAVAQPPAPKPRLWTRLYATLLPAWRKAPSLSGSFEPAVSTGAVRALRPLPAPEPLPDSESVKAGERRGLAELLSVSATGAQ